VLKGERSDCVEMQLQEETCTRKEMRRGEETGTIQERREVKLRGCGWGQARMDWMDDGLIS
jgi:hypothetical protein